MINAVRNGNLEYIQNATIASSKPLANLNTLLRLAAEGGFQLLDLIITELKSHMTC